MRGNRCGTAARPPSLGSGNTSWMTSAPPAATHLAQPSKSRCSGGLGVAAVDEQELQRRAPAPGDDRRLAHHRDDVVVEPGGVQRAAEGRQRVEQAGDRIDQRGVVELPAGLVLLGAVMMVDRVEHARRVCCGRRTQQQRRTCRNRCRSRRRCRRRGSAAPRRKRPSLVGGHEAPHLLGKREQTLGGASVSPHRSSAKLIGRGWIALTAWWVSLLARCQGRSFWTAVRLPGRADGQPCGASEILLSGLPSVWQYVCAESRVALISRELGSAPFLSLSILLTSSLCFFSSCVVKSLHLVSPPVLMTFEAEHPLNISAAMTTTAGARGFITGPF